MNYINETIGNIAIIKGIVFKDSKNNTSTPDHAWESGRPCIIIYESQEYFYFLSLTSTERNDINSIASNQYFKLEENDLAFKYKNRYKNEGKKKRKDTELHGFINLESIYKIPIYGLDEIGKLKLNVFKDIIDKFKIYHASEIEEEIKMAITVKR